MRKIIIIFALVALLLPLAELGAVSAQVNPIRITLNGQPLTTDVAPITRNGRTLVPFRAIFESLGARVTWDEAANTVAGYRGRQAIILELGSTTAWVNGPSVRLEVAPQAVDGRTMVPLRFVAERLGAQVEWVDATRTVAITATLPVLPAVGGAITHGRIADATILNPILANDVDSNFVLARTNVGVLRRDENGELINALADRWQWNAQTRTFRFWLRPGLVWHDGRPLTARDVKFTIEAILHPEYTGRRRGDFASVSGITVVSDHIVDITLSTEDATFIGRMTMGLIPQHVFEGTTIRDMAAHSFSTNPIGAGPYRFVRWVRGQFIELARNPNWHLDGPFIERVVIRAYPDSNVLHAAWEAGDIDWGAAVPSDIIPTVLERMRDRARFFEIPAIFGYDYVGLNLTNPILADLRVRQALMYGIDRPAIVRTVFDGRANVVHGHLVPSHWAHNPNLYTYPHNRLRAIDLLRQAGFTTVGRDGIRTNAAGQRLSFRFLIRTGIPERHDTLAMLQSYWRLIGIEILPEVLEWSVLVERLNTVNFDMNIMGWSFAEDPDSFTIFHSSQGRNPATGRNVGMNNMQLNDAEVDRLIMLGRTTIDETERRAIYQRLDVRLNEILPYVFLHSRNGVVGVHNRIQGGVVGLRGLTFPETLFIAPGR
ncbi:MAG: Oligopeptide-binding protein AppA [Firmicutes bacterium]|nr:Oligopeptide-binding protein AppA [candidate division NPL-UPA2 bacterium]